MKPVQDYTSETIEKLKQWINDMNTKGNTKYFEIYIDGIRVVHKTNDINMFDSYEKWMSVDTQLVKALVYNTQNSHRSIFFEFRTINYIPEVNYKEVAEALQKENLELRKRVSDAEMYITKLETKTESSEKNSGFDLQSILTMFGTLAKMNPEMANNLGLGNLFNSPPEKTETQPYAETSFKKKENKETVNTETADSNKKESEKLKKEDSEKLSELNTFFIDNPLYIAVIYELIQAEKLKNAA